jgi:hypothetical protein
VAFLVLKPGFQFFEDPLLLVYDEGSQLVGLDSPVEDELAGFFVARGKYSQAALLFNRIYKEVCVIWGSSVLLLSVEKNTATLRVTINDERSDGKWRKNRELFSLEVNHQWTMF